MRAGLPTGTVTFLFTDIEGSTRLLDELGEQGYVEALAEHRRLLREAFGAHGGVEVDTQGDAFLYAFAEAGAALLAGANGQQVLASGPFRVRMGVHTGKALLTGEGYAGRELHRAARIAAAGHGGQVVVSYATAALVDGELSELGEHRLKDFDEPVTLLQLGKKRFPPLKTISNTNLPRPASSFVGRQQERDELISMLSDGTRLLTLSGPGGSGKTRLAIETAAELVTNFNAGVFWVGLSALREPRLLSDEIAQTLGAKEDLAEHIGEREMLLLLDNFEQIVEAAPKLPALLERCPHLKLLVTSRELLSVRGEVDYPVPALAERDAVELFCSRAQLEPDEPIGELCRRLDDMPLAIELAAGRTRVLTPAQILDRLAQRLDLLKGGRDADPRQQTLRATIKWSYELLSEPEQTAFTRLSGFTGSFDLEAADVVAGADIDIMSSLVDKSLVRRHQEGRFFLLETIRSFGLDELEQRGALEDVREKHGHYYLRLVRESASVPHASFDETWGQRFLLEEPQLRTALATLGGQGHASELEEMCMLLWYTWDHFGRLTEARAQIEEALKAPMQDPRQRALLEGGLSCVVWRQGDGPAAVAAAERAVSILRKLDDRAQLAHTLRALSNAYRLVGDFLPADRALAESAELAQAVGDVYAAGAALVNRGSIAVERGDDEAALELGTAAVEFATANAFPAAAAAAHHDCGNAHLHLGNIDAAEASFKASLLAVEDRMAPYQVLYPVVSLAAVAARRGEVLRAARLLGAAGRICEDTGIVLEDVLDEIHREAVAATLAALGQDAYSQASAKGAELSLEDLVREALSAS